jgi:hypothetical protein
MNQVTEEKKEALTKVLAIAGFIAVIIFAVWLAVQIVKVIPGAFSSLASIADVVYNYNGKEELEVSTPNSVVNAGDSFTINWTDMRKQGTYSFSYECTDGVSVEIRTNGAINSVACDTELDLGDVTSLELRVSSEKFRFVDVPYTITFTEVDSEEKIAKKSTVTLVNASIPTSGVVDTTDNEEKETPVVTKPVVTKPVAPVKPTYTAGKPITTTKYVYVTPVSDPKGKIDLQVTFLGVGTLVGKTFVPKAVLDADENGALQFEVKNIGTKTSGEWEYEANLPSDITYASPDQKGLKPNERAVITLGFSEVSAEGSEKIGVEITTKNDSKQVNNEFTKTIKIVD